MRLTIQPNIVPTDDRKLDAVSEVKSLSHWGVLWVALRSLHKSVQRHLEIEAMQWVFALRPLVDGCLVSKRTPPGHGVRHRPPPLPETQTCPLAWWHAWQTRGRRGFSLAPRPGVAVVAPVPYLTVIFPQKIARDLAEGCQVCLLHSLGGYAQPPVVHAHVMCHRGRPVQVFLVDHRYMVQVGPNDGPHLLGIDLEQLPMEGVCGEVRVGIGVEVQKGVCHLRLQGHTGPRNV